MSAHAVTGHRGSGPRLVVVGAGWWSTNHHLPSLDGYGGAQLVAVCDADRDRARQAVEEHVGGDAEGPRPQVLTDLEEVLAIEPDGVLVATPHDTHHGLVGRLLDAGIPTFVEKPLVTTAEDAVDLVRRATAAGVEVMVGYTDQVTSTSALVRHAVQHEIGDLVQVVGEFSSATAGLFTRAERGATDPGEQDAADQHPDTYRPDRGGGQAHTQLTHLLGMICWATGREVATVAAMTADHGLDADVDDAAVLTFVGGGTGAVTSTGLAGQAGGERHHVRYLGSRGTVDHDMLADDAWLHRGDGTSARLCGHEGETPRTWLPARRFADLVAGRATNPAPLRPAAAAAACTDALLTSAAERRFVDVRRLP